MTAHVRVVSLRLVGQASVVLRHGQCVHVRSQSHHYFRALSRCCTSDVSSEPCLSVGLYTPWVKAELC